VTEGSFETIFAALRSLVSCEMRLNGDAVAAAAESDALFVDNGLILRLASITFLIVSPKPAVNETKKDVSVPRMRLM